MKIFFRKVMYLGAFALTFGTSTLMTSCKDKDQQSASVEKALADEDDDLLAGLSNLLSKSCGEDGCEADDEDDDLELVDVDTIIDDEDGTEIPVAYFKCGNEIFQMMDIDGDGTFDVAVYDADDDGDITDDEIVDVSSEGITIDAIAEMAGCSMDCDETEGCDSSCGDSEECEGGTCSSSGRRLQRQHQEEADELDLPDYVNNAHVKALRKK